MSETRKMSQHHKQDLTEIHIRLPHQLARLARVAAAFDEESFSFWLANAVEKRLEDYPFLKGL